MEAPEAQADAHAVELKETVAVVQMRADASAVDTEEGVVCFAIDEEKTLRCRPPGIFAHLGDAPFILLVTAPSDGAGAAPPTRAHALLLQSTAGARDQLRLLAPADYTLAATPRAGYLLGTESSPAPVALSSWRVGEKARVASRAAGLEIVAQGVEAGAALSELLAFEGSFAQLAESSGVAAVLSVPGALRCLLRDKRSTVTEALALYSDAGLATPSPADLYAAGFPASELWEAFSDAEMVGSRLPLAALTRAPGRLDVKDWALHHVRRGASTCLVLSELARAGLAGQRQMELLRDEELWAALASDGTALSAETGGTGATAQHVASLVPGACSTMIREAWGARVTVERMGLAWCWQSGGVDGVKAVLLPGEDVGTALRTSLSDNRVPADEKAVLAEALNELAPENQSGSEQRNLLPTVSAALAAGAVACLGAVAAARLTLLPEGTTVQ